MMNLLGCSKENFNTLMSLMNYKKIKDSKNIFFYAGNREIKKKSKFISTKHNPFKKLESLKI